MTTTVRMTGRTLRGSLIAALATALAGLLAAPIVAPAATKRSKPSALPAFSSCPSLLSYARHHARRTGGFTGVPTRAGVVAPQVLRAPSMVAEDAAGVAPPLPSMAVTAKRGTSEPSFSSTNVQELGVDEPDIVKTDGRRVFAIADGRLLALDAGAGEPKLVGSLDLAGGSGGHQLLLRGDRV